MKKVNIGIFVILMGIFYFVVFQEKKNTDEKTKKILILIEDAYFQGHVDAIDGDIRIEKISDSNYVWTKSPWTDSEPLLDTLKRNK